MAQRASNVDAKLSTLALAAAVESAAIDTQNRACFSISSFLDHIHNTSRQ
ncbi:MAG: hypothetical protein WBG36_17500 [Ornithinimicrobium sp.]